MGPIDLHGELTAVELSPPAARTSTVTGTGVDVSRYKGVLKVTQQVGTVSGTTPTLDGKIQDSANDSTYADVTGYTFTQVTASTNLQSLGVDTRNVRQYVRYVGTIAGTSPSFGLAVSFIGQKEAI